MKIIHHRTGLNINECNDVEILREIIFEQMVNGLSLAEEYGFFVLKCYKQNLPIIDARDWIKIRNK